jgi:hypothetical protein
MLPELSVSAKDAIRPGTPNPPVIEILLPRNRRGTAILSLRSTPATEDCPVSFATALPDLAAIKQRQQATWAAGDYSKRCSIDVGRGVDPPMQYR